MSCWSTFESYCPKLQRGTDQLSKVTFQSTHGLLINFRKLLAQVATWDGPTFERYFPKMPCGTTGLSKVTFEGCRKLRKVQVKLRKVEKVNPWQSFGAAHQVWGVRKLPKKLTNVKEKLRKVEKVRPRQAFWVAHQVQGPPNACLELTFLTFR